MSCSIICPPSYCSWSWCCSTYRAAGGLWSTGRRRLWTNFFRQTSRKRRTRKNEARGRTSHLPSQSRPELKCCSRSALKLFWRLFLAADRTVIKLHANQLFNLFQFVLLQQEFWTSVADYFVVGVKCAARRQIGGSFTELYPPTHAALVTGLISQQISMIHRFYWTVRRSLF